MPQRNTHLLGLLLLPAALLLFSSLAHAPTGPSGKARLERFVAGLRSPTGIVVAPDGTLHFTDEQEGTLFRRDSSGILSLLEDRLERPRGLARGQDGTLFFVAEERRDRGRGPRPRGLLLKRDPDGAVMVLVSGLKEPQHVAVAPDDDHLVLSAEGGLRHRSAAEMDGREDEDEDEQKEKKEDDAESSGLPRGFPGTIVRLNRNGQMIQVHPGFRRPSGVLISEDGSIIVAAEGFQRDGPRHRGSLFQIDPAGPVSLLLPERFKKLRGLVQDALGFFYLAVEERQDGEDEDEGRPHGGLILRVAPEGIFSHFAQGFERPWGLALDPAGNLYVTDPEAGRIYRFLAPGPPDLAPLPGATNRSSVTLAGTTEPQARITVRGGLGEARALADAGGNFILDVLLSPGLLNTLAVYGTGAKGEGLTGRPAPPVSIVQDADPPTVAFEDPAPGSCLSGTVAVKIRATDGLSGIATVELLVDGTPPTSQAPPGFPSAHDAVFCLDTTQFPPGGPDHTLTAVVVDRAANRAEAHRTITVASLRVTITEPREGDSVPAGSLLVRGTVEGEDPEVGVLVNGVLAAVQGRDFAALIPVPPDPPILTLTALATAAKGGIAKHTISLTVTSPPVGLLGLHVSPASGVEPLTVVFSLLGGPVPATITLDLEDDGTPEFSGASLDGMLFTYANPGLYFPTVTVTDAQGQAHTARAVLQVSNRSALDSQLQARWTALKEALDKADVTGDVTGAVEIFAQSSREAYGEQFKALATVPGALKQVAADLGAITLVRVRDGAAEYDLRAVRTRGGTNREYSFYVLFVIDTDGLWRLRAF